MHMIGHQYIGMDVDTTSVRRLSEMLQIEMIVSFPMKTRCAVVSPLDHVVWATRQIQPRQSGHESLQCSFENDRMANLGLREKLKNEHIIRSRGQTP